MTPQRARVLAAVAIGCAVFVLHALCIPQQALTDDDDFYATAGIRYAAWFPEVLTAPREALSNTGVTRAFTSNHEHPPFAKLVFGLTHAVAHDVLNVYGDLDAVRLGTALFAAVLAALLVLWLWVPLGAMAAIGAPLLLLSLPRFFFHSEVATLDVPVAVMVVAVTASFSWAWKRGSTRAGVAVAVVFACAALTKLNAPFAVFPCVFVWLFSAWREVRVTTHGLKLPTPPPVLLWMAILSPLLFVALWPWLWFDTGRRLGEYVAFHLQHYPIHLFYDGEVWDKPWAPWHAAFVLGFGSVPAPILALSAVGMTRAGAAVVRLVRAGVPVNDDAARVRSLVLLQAVLSIGVVAFSDVPKYGGEKLFMPFFPLLCILAADGATAVVAAIETLVPTRDAGALAARGAGRVLAFGCIVALACAPGAWFLATEGPAFALSYYGETVGGLRGAVARGYERTYYDVADKDLAYRLDALAQQRGGLRVHFEPNHKEYARTYRWLVRDGVISKRVQLVSEQASADVVVLTHERRWTTYPALLQGLVAHGVLFTKAIDGVPLYTIFEQAPAPAPVAKPPPHTP